jgi:hypothetical protein
MIFLTHVHPLSSKIKVTAWLMGWGCRMLSMRESPPASLQHLAVEISVSVVYSRFVEAAHIVLRL